MVCQEHVMVFEPLHPDMGAPDFPNMKVHVEASRRHFA